MRKKITAYNLNVRNITQVEKLAKKLHNSSSWTVNEILSEYFNGIK